MRTGYFLACFGVATALAACGETEEQRQAREAAADADPSLISACTAERVRDFGIPQLSWSESAAMCETMRASLGRQPSVAEFRYLSKVVELIHLDGSTEHVSELGYQVMCVVEARGDASPMRSTFDVVAKVFKGTSGRVTPKDLNAMLRQSGNLAHTMSDESVIYMAALMWEEKKHSGG